MGAGDVVTPPSTVSNLVYNMAVSFGDIGTQAVDMLVDLIPVLAPVVGGVIVCALGFRFVRRYSR